MAQPGVELVVSNPGKPIDTETFARMFDPLRRGGMARSGEAELVSLGLGLYVVRQIATAHGGSGRAESADGKTTFTVSLPDTPTPAD